MRDSIKTHYTQLKNKLDGATLIAVSKRQPLEKIEWLYELGQRQFGENYVQEGVEKITALADKAIEWHFIGQIQANKTKLIATHFSWVQSVDRIKIAERLNSHCVELNKQLSVCIHVNIDDEPQKGGVAVADLEGLAQFIAKQPNLVLRGLMVIPRPREQQVEMLATFQRVKQLFDCLNDNGLKCDTLSMGMSQDYALALQAGATMVRIGTALFGARD